MIRMSSAPTDNLLDYLGKETMQQTDNIRWFDDLGIDDVTIVGGKNASLGEMYCQLSPLGVHVPNGFATTAKAYRSNTQKINEKITSLLAQIKPNDVNSLSKYAKKIRILIYETCLNDALKTEILQAYQQLKTQYGNDISVAVRSSATAEDLPTASFAGQHDSYLNIIGEDALIDAYRHCFASLFNDRAIAYRDHNNYDHMMVAMSVGVMKMVRSDIASSGVMFSLDTDTGFQDVVFITSTYGLGENIVQGNVDPDEFYVHKPTFKQGYRKVLYRRLGNKQSTMVYAETSHKETIQDIETTAALRQQFSICDADVLTLADYAIKTEQHYSDKKGKPCPMDMEWAKDGIDGKLYLIQARPETIISQQDAFYITEYTLKESATPLSSGRAVGDKIVHGRARKINTKEDLAQFQTGEILVTDTTSPDWGPVMNSASAIITNRGGRTCHAAIVARELGIPAVVGTGDATQRIEDGAEITVSCAQGSTAYVYPGSLAFTTNRIDIKKIAQLKTQIMLNIGDPEHALSYAHLPCDGVGLARIEFIISNTIRAHPMALLYPEKVRSAKARQHIAELTQGYTSGPDYFIEKLSEGIAMIAAAFYPKPVIVRTSDFKTNEYASLIGGDSFEFIEDNPMIGFRGAARYSHPAYAKAFGLECKAIKRVRNEMGFDNIKVMIPFCRRVKEGEEVLQCMATHGLKQHENGLEVYVMCEIPNNVILIDQFAQLFDGLSIGSNDLTQLTLGVDRDSEIVAFEFDEHDPGVLEMMRLVIVGAHRNKRPVGICGQAPSDYPDIAEYLVSLNIDSISLNPDSLFKTREHIAAIEEKLQTVKIQET